MLASSTGAGAQDSILRLTERPGSEVHLRGTTTIRAGWSCSSDRPGATMEIDTRRTQPAELLTGALRTSGVSPGAVKRIHLRVPVADLDCGNPLAGRALRKALREQDVVGEFRLASGTTSTSSKVRVSGQLTVAGVTRDVTLDVATSWGSDGTVRASGSLPLQLSDFGIEPPRVLFSAVRASDHLTVTFDLLLAVAAADRASIVAQRPGPAAAGR